MPTVRALLGKLKPELKAVGKPEELEANLDKVRAKFKEFPHIQSAHVGRAVNENNKGYDFLVVLLFDDHPALRGFVEHPTADIAKEELLRPFVEEIIVVDINA